MSGVVLLLRVNGVHLQILRSMVQVFADDPFQCAVLAHLREGIIQLVVQPAAVIFGKGNAQPGDQQRLFEMRNTA